MTLVELKQILEATGYPVDYSHFKDAQAPPFICYLVEGNPNFMADNKVYHKVSDVNIELYTTKKDLVAEATLEKVLDDHEIPYDSFEAFIDSEELFQKTYEVRLI